MTNFEKISTKIQELTTEANKYKNNAKFANNEFVAKTQMGLYKLTMEKIAKLETLINKGE